MSTSKIGYVLGNTDDLGKYDAVKNVKIKDKGSLENENNIIIYPNPVSKYFKVISKTNTIKQVYLMDSKGRIIQQFNTNSQEFEVNCNKINGGLYLVTIITNNSISTHKISILK